MDSLERALIEKAGYGHGFENVRESTSERVVLFSARHRAQACVSRGDTGAGGGWYAAFLQGPSQTELVRTLPEISFHNGTFGPLEERALSRLLRRAAELACALPNHAAEEYRRESARIEAAPPSATEAVRLTKQRMGQELYRQALLDYWSGCAVTGIEQPELLRASHAKPWTECGSDEERLNVFNGFLLCAHLDALFDRGLLSFTDDGVGLLSPVLSQRTVEQLQLNANLRLRWVAPDHHVFLQWHRQFVFQKTEPG
jgi:putative restriction endonuclease